MPTDLNVIRVLIVDDHPVVCEGVRLLLAASPDIVIDGSVRTAGAAVEAARTSAPDIVLLDLRLPDMLATEAVALLRTAAPSARIVVFTAHAGHRALRAARAAGIDGCLLKDVGEEDLAGALRRVSAGEVVIDPRLAKEMHSTAFPVAPGVGLTSREYEILRRVAMGETNPEIAGATGLTRNTVKTYVQSTLRKLGARNRVEALSRAAELDLL